MSLELSLKSADINLPQNIENLAELKAELIPRLEKYNNLVVTEDSIKDAKADKAALNKLKTFVDDERKRIKKLYLEPYNVLEAQCKEVVSLIDAPIQAIDKQIKAFDEIEKQNKYAELEAYFATLNAPEWVKINDVINPKWGNKTEKLDSLKAEMAENVKKLEADFNKLTEMYGESPVYIPIINRFKQTKDFSQTAVYAVQLEADYKREEERKKRIEEERQRAEAAKQAERTESVSNALASDSNKSNINIPPVQQTAVSVESESNEKLIRGTFTVECTESKLIALRHYIDSEGIKIL